MTAQLHAIDDERRRKAVTDLDSQLARGDKGVIGCLSNMILIVGKDPALADLCAYDEFAGRAVIRAAPPVAIDGMQSQPGPYPRSWQAQDVSLVQSYIQRVWCRSASKGDTEDAMLAIAASRRFHPVRDWLGTLTWDYKPRVDSWLHSAFGAPDDHYTRAVAASFLIAAVRRVRHPGVKHDHMPVLEGLQGLGKSKALAALFGGEWFTDSLPAALESRDAMLGLLGVWCIEFAEIEQLIRAEIETIKAFLARQVDRYRAPYARGYTDHPRQCVLVGTTNADDYLRDSTGNRRFWPVRCTKADDSWIAANRAQLWAEAAHLEARGEPHWLDVQEIANAAEAQQRTREQGDVWDDRISEIVKHRDTITSADILSALEIPVERQGRREQMRVADVLRRTGWRTTAVYNPATRKTKREWVRLEMGGGS